MEQKFLKIIKGEKMKRKNSKTSKKQKKDNWCGIVALYKEAILQNRDFDEEISIKGKWYKDTAYFSLQELCLFMERDIFLAIKRGELPKIKVEFLLGKKNSRHFIKVLVQEVSGKILNPDFIKGQFQLEKTFRLYQDFFQKNSCNAYTELGRDIKDQIGQILKKYNYKVFHRMNGEIKCVEQRFVSSVEYPISYTSWLLRRVLGVPTGVGPNRKYLIYRGNTA